MKYLIVSGGEVKEGFLTWIVKNGGFDVILAADAGMEALYRDHILPDIIVGDFDSVNPDTLEYFHDKEQIEVCMLNPEKDDTHGICDSGGHSQRCNGDCGHWCNRYQN